MAEGLVLSLGGNALIRPGEEGDIPQQVDRARETFRALAPLLAGGRRALLVHGNGPQVGNELLRSEIAEEEGGLFHLPLDVLVADCQGAMGYVLQRELGNVLSEAGESRCVATLVTQVLVDPADPAFARPSKPVGGFHSEEEARELRAAHGFEMSEDSGRGWRRLVPSPRPVEVVEAAAVEALWAAGVVVIAGGGGGVAVASGSSGLEGREAVVDKDRTTALLAERLRPELVVMVTGVPALYRDFRGPSEQRLERASASELRALAAAGEFPETSMGPKVEALVRIVEEVDGCEALVSSPESLSEALAGRAGTRVVRS